MDRAMEATGSQWYNRIAAEIGQYQYSLGPKEAKKYKLDLLRRVAWRIDDFSHTCGECETLKSEVSRLVQEMSILVQMLGRQGTRNHTKSVNSLVEHLKKVHKLVDKGHYMGMGVGIGWAIGAGLGALLGAAFDNPGIGTAVGIGLGIIVGIYLDRKAEREGKVI